MARLPAEPPEPFAPATPEKRAELNRSRPHGVLAPTGRERAARRRFTEEAPVPRASLPTTLDHFGLSFATRK